MDIIRTGARGEAVADVQARLVALGYTIPPEERAAFFGEGTESAVRVFQQDRGLIVDGIVGPDTWRELVEASWRLGDRVLYLRAPHLRGDDVRELQDRLATFGFDVGRTDGIFGATTARALVEFQRNYGLPPDGIVAEQTVRALDGLPRIAGDTPILSVREREAMRTRSSGLAGMRIVLDPGHGGDDTGVVSAEDEGQDEASTMFSIARAMEAPLAAGGAHVYLTRRESDSPDHIARAALANALDADVFVSLHAAAPDAGGSRAFYYGHARYRSEAGMHLASLLVEQLEAAGARALGCEPKTFTLLRETRMPAVFIEVDPSAAVPLTVIADALREGLRRFAHDPVAV